MEGHFGPPMPIPLKMPPRRAMSFIFIYRNDDTFIYGLLRATLTSLAAAYRFCIILSLYS